MDQSVTAALNTYILFSFNKKLIKDDANLITFWKSITIKDTIYSVSKAWDAVKQILLIHAWHKLLSGEADDKDFEGFENIETCNVEM